MAADNASGCSSMTQWAAVGITRTRETGISACSSSVMAMGVERSWSPTTSSVGWPMSSRGIRGIFASALQDLA